MIQLDQKLLVQFKTALEEREASRSTIQKYMHDVSVLADYCTGTLRDKSDLIAFKEHLQQRGYAPSSVNSMLAAINQFLAFAGHPEWKLRTLKIQRATFMAQERELNQEEYESLVRTAEYQGNERLAMLLQTICATGIRVSEVQAVTVEALKRKRAEIRSKGKVRLILLPDKLCRKLMDYCEKKKISSGPVFITRTGRPLDRSNIWKMMKRLAAQAKVGLSKAFPHSLRHLFACTYYQRYKDIVRLADILGHSSVDTTRIYTTKNADEQQRQLECLNLLFCV